MGGISRREMLATAGAAAFTASGVQGAETEKKAETEEKSEPKKQKIMVVGGHPDDPETGCGGTIAHYTEAGYEVVIVYLTRGEAGIRKKSFEEAAQIRTAEAEEACRILGARPIFVGQVDSQGEATNARYDEFRKIVEAEKPDAMFTHWPIDGHRDHRAAYMVSYDAWIRLKRPFDLFFYEVCTGDQTTLFAPTDYVDIAKTEPRKRMAIGAHVSQHPDQINVIHDLMNQARGMEFGCKLAEGFVRHVRGPGTHSLPVS